MVQAPATTAIRLSGSSGLSRDVRARNRYGIRLRLYASDDSARDVDHASRGLGHSGKEERGVGHDVHRSAGDGGGVRHGDRGWGIGAQAQAATTHELRRLAARRLHDRGHDGLGEGDWGRIRVGDGVGRPGGTSQRRRSSRIIHLACGMRGRVGR